MDELIVPRGKSVRSSVVLDLMAPLIFQPPVITTQSVTVNMPKKQLKLKLSLDFAEMQRIADMFAYLRQNVDVVGSIGQSLTFQVLFIDSGECTIILIYV